MAKHDMTSLSFEPASDDFYRARINTLEKENEHLKAELEKRASYYSMGRDQFDKYCKEISDENDKLREKVMKLERALLREVTKDVEVL